MELAFNCTLYKFSKKRNSTKRPTGGTTFSIELKSPCDIIQPTIVINQANLGLIPNYAYIPQFERYYFVVSQKWENGLWHIGMKVDALATWKTEIGAQALYVTRCSQEYDGQIMDNLYPAKSKPTFSHIDKTSGWNSSDITTGTFVVGVAGQNTTYYTFTYNGLQLFLQYLLGTLYANELTSSWSSVYSDLDWIANPLQYITGITWFPFAYAGPPVSTIRVGYVDVPVAGGEVLGSGLVFFTTTFTPPKHPQATTRGEYLNNAPYSDYSLFYPPFGQIQLDPDIVANTTDLEALVYVDLRTGNATLTILDNDNTVLTSWIHSRIGQPYQTSEIKTQGTFDLAKTVGMIGSMAPAMATGNVAGVATGLISNGTNAIGDYARGKIPSARTLGSQGGMNSLRGDIILQCDFKELVDEDNISRGRPYCKVATINTLAGYIMVSDADVSIPAEVSELEEITQYMEGGFFYE